ncbi:hypothetical protein AAMO2058_001227300 [Amorphochlora amoebiformis]
MPRSRKRKATEATDVTSMHTVSPSESYDSNVERSNGRGSVRNSKKRKRKALVAHSSPGGIFARPGVRSQPSGKSILDEINEVKKRENSFRDEDEVQDEDGDEIFEIFSKTRNGSQDSGEKDGEGEDDESEDRHEEGIDFNDALTDPQEEEVKEEGGGEQGGGGKADIINVEFEFFDPSEKDYHGLHTILRKWLGNDAQMSDDWNNALRNLADILSNQASVGTLIKCDTAEDTPPLAFISAISLYTHRKSSIMKFIRSYLTKRAPSNAKKNFQKVWKSGVSGKKPIGLLIHERLINVPPALVPVLHAELTKDLDWAQKNEITQELRSSFKFNELVYITRAYYPEDDADKSAPKATKSGKKKKSAKEEKISSNRQWFRFEDEILEDISSLSFSFPLTPKTDASQGLDLLAQELVVMVLPVSRLPEAITRAAWFLSQE